MPNPTLWIINNCFEGPERSVNYSSAQTIEFLQASFPNNDVKPVSIASPTSVPYIRRFSSANESAECLLHLNIKHHDVVFFLSVEFLWGLAGIVETWKVQGKKVYTCGIWRNSVCLPGDYIGHNPFYIEKEKEILRYLDVSFFSSTHVMNCVGAGTSHPRPIVTGLSTKTCDPEWIKPIPDKNPVLVFPHRPDYSKNFPFFLKVARDILNKHQIRSRILTARPITNESLLKEIDDIGIQISVNSDRKQYFNELCYAAASFSCSTLESYGFAMVESYKCGCVPIVPNFATYPELFSGIGRLYDYRCIEQNNYAEVSEIIFNTILVYPERKFKVKKILGDYADEMVAFHISHLLRREQVIN